MNNRTLDAVMLWTGGKDSAMALHEAVASGYRVGRLVTFAPPEPAFLSHPLAVIKQQAAAMALPTRHLELRSTSLQSPAISGLRRTQESRAETRFRGPPARDAAGPNLVLTCLTGHATLQRQDCA